MMQQGSCFSIWDKKLRIYGRNINIEKQTEKKLMKKVFIVTGSMRRGGLKG